MKKTESLPFVRKAKFLLHILIASVFMISCATGTKDENIGDGDIGGTVTGPNGPEAGVWVIAETFDLPTRFAKIVVTDDSGRYLLPELPKANYKVWVRGYGLVDSEKKDAKPGSKIDLTAVVAPSEKEAAQYYPAGYWFSLLNVPDKTKCPGTGPTGNGIKSPGQFSSKRQIRDLSRLPPTRQQTHARISTLTRKIQKLHRCMGAKITVGSGRWTNDRRGDGVIRPPVYFACEGRSYSPV